MTPHQAPLATTRFDVHSAPPGVSPMAAPRLQVDLHASAGDAWRRTFRIGPDGLPVVLGRSGSLSGVVLPFSNVSRRHAELHLDGQGRLRLRDLGSTGGTFVNGARVDDVALVNGDVVRVGEVVVRVEVQLPSRRRADPEQNQRTDRIAAVRVATSCSLCRGGIDGAAFGGALILQDERALCAPCVGGLEPGADDGPLRLLRRVGGGACGEVHMALHVDRLKIVAVKTVPLHARQSGGALLTRLMREVSIGKRLDHPHIVKLHEAVTDGRSFRMIMDFVDGTCVRELVERAEGRLPLEIVARIARALGAALDHSHAAGVIHRDVKPANVMVDTAGRVRLTDFGLAKAVMGSEEDALGGATSIGQLLGTPAFMPPEQIQEARDAGPAADVYAMAATLYFAATGRQPIAYPDLQTLVVAILNEVPAPADRYRVDLPESAAAALARGLEKQPERRPSASQLAAEFVEAIERG